MAGRVTLVTLNYKELTNVLHVINTARAIKCIEHIVVMLYISNNSRLVCVWKIYSDDISCD